MSDVDSDVDMAAFITARLDEEERDAQTEEDLWEAIRNLAAVYGDHPDYRQEWAPQLSRESRHAAQNSAVSAGAPASGE